MSTSHPHSSRVRAQLAPPDTALVAPLLAAIDALNAQIKTLDLELETLAQERYPTTARLRQIAGVGLRSEARSLAVARGERWLDAVSAGGGGGGREADGAGGRAWGLGAAARGGAELELGAPG